MLRRAVGTGVFFMNVCTYSSSKLNCVKYKMSELKLAGLALETKQKTVS